ncbi:hypothetical protein CVT24_009463 [Panaeolus cyanescens]|uniref:Uncharacterized protein n=1 Tax=Panaeolus cyanescens TaxID=181874 RepID=A0A409W3L0_9AGAR|nr:hypothetical protein CVT24_009463 [Panaeolus cyanescens]
MALRALSLFIALLSSIHIVSAIVLHAQDRWIVDSNNKRVKLRCVNWAGHMEVGIPEGLQHQPVATIAAWVANNKFNCVRLTYSIDMALNPNQRVQDAFNNAASTSGASLSALQGLYNSALGKNSWLSSSTTQGAFGRVIQELGNRGVMVIMDNHVSKASWCCGTGDGNGWWAQAAGYNAANSRYFDTNNWLNGLKNIANFAKGYSNVVGMGLRNEVRAVSGQDGNNHADWYNYMGQGARAVSDANRDLLIIFGGVGYATDLGYLYSKPFDRSALNNKVVYEYHNYQWTYGDRSCADHKTLMGNAAGYLIASGKSYTGPLWVSEFGWNQNGASSVEVNYYRCLVEYLESNDADWAYWALQGSYYVRNGQVNYDESFGVLKADWSGWRNTGFTAALGKIWDQTQGP